MMIERYPSQEKHTRDLDDVDKYIKALTGYAAELSAAYGETVNDFYKGIKVWEYFALKGESLEKFLANLAKDLYTYAGARDFADFLLSFTHFPGVDTAMLDADWFNWTSIQGLGFDIVTQESEYLSLTLHLDNGVNLVEVANAVDQVCNILGVNQLPIMVVVPGESVSSSVLYDKSKGMAVSIKPKLFGDDKPSEKAHLISILEDLVGAGGSNG